MHAGETWKFELSDEQAERVYLVKECDAGFSSWIAMNRAPGGRWEVTTTLGRGHYRVRYFRVEANTFFNGGTAGLSARRLTADDPTVTLEHQRSRQTA